MLDASSSLLFDTGRCQVVWERELRMIPREVSRLDGLVQRPSRTDRSPGCRRPGRARRDFAAFGIARCLLGLLRSDGARFTRGLRFPVQLDGLPLGMDSELAFARSTAHRKIR